MIGFEILLMLLPFIFGQLSPGDIGKVKIPPVKDIPKPTEDSAAAVLMIVAASRGGFLDLPLSVIAWTENRMKAACEFVQGSRSGMLKIPSIRSMFPMFFARPE